MNTNHRVQLRANEVITVSDNVFACVKKIRRDCSVSYAADRLSHTKGKALNLYGPFTRFNQPHRAERTGRNQYLGR